MSKIIETILSKDYISDLSPKIAEGLGKQKTTHEHASLFESIRRNFKKKAYFEHYISHNEVSNIQNKNQSFDIVNPNYYLNIVTNDSAYYADKSFNDIDTHWKNLFKIPFDVTQLKEEENKEIFNSIIFPGVRHIEKNMIIFEMPPAYRHVSYQHAYRDGPSSRYYKEYYIPVPWQVYIATFSNDMRLIDVQMYFSKTSIYSMDQKLYSPPLLNFYGSGFLCRPFFNSLEDIEKYPKNISGIISSAFDWIWNTGFNWDITEPISQYLHSKSYESMQPFVDPEIYKSLVSYFDGCSPHSNASGPSVDAMFALWQTVPLEHVLDLNWISFCIYSDFYYQSIENYLANHFSTDFHDYIKINNIDIVDDNRYGDEESQDEESESEEHTFESVISSYHFQSFIAPKLYNFNSTLKHAYDIANIKICSYKLKTLNNYSDSKVYQTNSFVQHLNNKILEITSQS